MFVMIVICVVVISMLLATTADGMAIPSVGRLLPTAAGGEPKYRASLFPAQTLSSLLSLGYDAVPAPTNNNNMTTTTTTKNGVEVFLSKEEKEALEAAGVSVVVHQTAKPLMMQPPAGYRNPAQILQYMRDVAAQYPSIARLVNIGEEFAGGLTTYEGRDFYALKISDNVEEDEDEENILVQGLHHARELITPEICLDVVDRLTSGFGSDANMTYLVSNFQIWVWPTVNPDGLEYVWNVNDMWRKNRKLNSGSSSYGVDNNRNYDLGWDSSCGGSSVPSSDTYRGPAAHSEEENQMMVAITTALNFRIVADFHSYGQEVLYNYLCNPMPAAISSYVQRVSNDVATYADYATRLPSADGGHCQWTIKTTTLQCFLFETETAFQPSYDRCLAEIERVWPAVLNLLLRPSVLNGHVRDATTGAPVRAEVSVEQINWQMGETRFSSLPFGRYHYVLPTGTYTFVFSAPGYSPASFPGISLNENTERTLDVLLSPL